MNPTWAFPLGMVIGGSIVNAVISGIGGDFTSVSDSLFLIVVGLVLLEVAFGKRKAAVE